MAAQKVVLWFGLFGVFIVLGGVLWVVYDSFSEDTFDPTVTASNRGTETTGREQPPSENPSRRFEPTPGPRRAGPKRQAPKTPRTAAGPAVKEPGAAADYGRLDDYLLSTTTPTFYGVVSGPGGPVAGAAVTLFEEYPRPFGKKTVHGLATDRRGQFVFPPQIIEKHKRYHLKVSYRDRQSKFFWNLVRGKRLNVRLIEGVPLKGKVVDAEGEAIAKAEVGAQGKTWSEKVRADSEGRFTFPHAPIDELLKVLVTAEHYELKTLNNIRAGAGDVRVELKPGVPIEGKVVDGMTREPVAGATVSIGVPGLPERLRKAVTDEEGNYKIQGLAPGFITFFAIGSGYSETMKAMKLDRKPSATLSFELYPTGAVKGQVVDGKGAPVPGAKIYVGQKNVFVYFVPDPKKVAAVTDENGNFHLTDMNTSPRFDCKLVADHPDFRQGESAVLRPKPGQTLEGVKIAMAAGLYLKGRVLDMAGRGLAGARVQVTPFSSQRLTTVYFGNALVSNYVTETDEDGNFNLNRLSKGRVRVEVAAEDHLKKQEMLQIPEIGGIDGHIFNLERGFTIAGRVTDSAGKGVGNARVHASCPHPVNSFSNAVSNQEGYFKVGNLKQGFFKLTVRATGYAEQNKENVKVDEKKADFILMKNGSVAGLVTSGVDGSPVAEFTVNLSRQKPDGSFGWYRDFNQKTRDGRYECSDVEPGLYRVIVRSKEFAPRERVGVPVATGAPTVGIDFVLSPGNSVFGRVTDAGGVVPPGAHVVAQPVNANGKPNHHGQSRTERTKKDGTFRIRGLSDGLYRIKPLAGGFCQSGGQILHLGGDRAFQVNLLVNKGGHIRVKVTDQRGQAVTGADVMVTDAGGNKWGAVAGGAREGHEGPAGAVAGGDMGGDGVGGGMPNRTGMTGEFKLATPICPGPAIVRVTARGYRAAQKSVIVVDESEIQCRVVVRP